MAGLALSVGMVVLAGAMPASAAPSCSQPLTGGDKPMASDCLHILKAAVNLVTCQPSCVCRPTGGDEPRVNDALLCLRVATGSDLFLDCPCDGASTTTTLGVSTTSTTFSGETTTTTLGDCPALDTCVEQRGPNGEDPKDSDGCSADRVIEVLGKLGLEPEDPEAVKDDPLHYFTGGLCSAPFGNDGNLDDPRACELHDICLTICQEDEGTCDAEFGARMAETCLETYLVGPCRDSCLLLAATYVTAVSAGENGPYPDNQELTCTCCPDRSACGDGICDDDIGEGAANCPADCLKARADAEPCLTHSECESGFCNYKARCGLSPCGDGHCGAGEACGQSRFCPEDCGGCPNGQPCLLDQDCESDYCLALVCRTRPVCGDGSCNGVEVCGGSDTLLECNNDCGACPNGNTCLTHDDCASDICNFGFCIAGDLEPLAPCSADRACRSNDCVAGLCAASCGDDVCNGTERCGNANSGLECNADCGKCGNGHTCLANNDCSSGICNFGFCISGPRDDGKTCSTDAACKSGDCTVGLCRCTRKGLGSKCSSNSQCCSDKCSSVLGTKRCV